METENDNLQSGDNEGKKVWSAPTLTLLSLGLDTLGDDSDPDETE